MLGLLAVTIAVTVIALLLINPATALVAFILSIIYQPAAIVFVIVAAYIFH